MDDDGELLGIGAFARRVGLTPSALRFYDDCGVLRPDRVDAATGYRRYGVGQVARAVRLRQLRSAGLPLVDVETVLDGPEGAARDVLRAHLERTRRAADEARAVAEGLLGEAAARPADRGGAARARVGGPELASAVRQVGSAAAVGATAREFPVLGCVLLELAEGEVRLVATDRYRLAVRVLRPEVFEGGPRRALIAVDTARRMAEWAVRRPEVEVEWAAAADASEAAGVWLRSGGACWAAGDVAAGVAEPGEFPDYRLMLTGLGDTRQRLIVDRAALRDVVTDRGGAVASLVIPAEAEEAADAALEVSGGEAGPVRLRAVRTGPGLRIAFDPAVLVPALEAGVGPDVLLEIAAPDQPVVVRSADQGSFTTVVMPVRGC
ncbi:MULTISPECIES: MerR family transcriptional regulator [unclassified Streptomyces]|uniref:MerR family transcriptional regulator n=1 Tax=unclassified Streptomyces TaxID=2593676 RepID=UPI00037193D5|nr:MULTISPECIES: MerR family transcriptional regulator [unclassified Streptomyces]MYT32427.1 MerR family transcriptional regulator [Streptomyces sp. SID8354]